MARVARSTNKPEPQRGSPKETKPKARRQSATAATAQRKRDSKAQTKQSPAPAESSAVLAESSAVLPESSAVLPESSATADFEARLRDRMPFLTPKRRVLAQIMLTDPAALMLRTVESLAQEAGVDGATVVRLCNELEYDGFAGLKSQLRDDYTRFRTAAEKISRTLAAGQTEEDAVPGVFSRDSANIALAAEWNSAAKIAELAETITAARRTVIVASGLSSHAASLAAHLLRLAGVDAIAPTTEIETAIHIADLGTDDLVIGISFWRYIASSERLLIRAAAADVQTAAITDSSESGVARASQQVLRVPTDSAELSNSLTATVALINAIVTAVIHSNPDRSLSALKRIDSVFSDTQIT
ncbi:MurR/RpiR family transcriptional regulator [Mycobacterium sp. AZCC_0083]|uniref:MurR/RpiR family transcriptional regulator n=1 Tax=Mycobacterium sp. AZCC_0083 TaxID=2735882 RepID=UPI002105F7D9|nr:SIS domain-containing protein [Mycobacterium sp. AZCC_0083]